MAETEQRRLRRLRRWLLGTACLVAFSPQADAQERFPVASAARLAPPVLFAEATGPELKQPVQAEAPTLFAVGLGTPSVTPLPGALEGPELVQTQARVPLPRPSQEDGSEDQPILVTIKIDTPGPSELFRLESEADWRERMRRDAKQNYPFNRLDFPESRKLTPLENEIKRNWPMRFQFAEPNYLCYRRLFFEDINTERYGWDLGVLQPVASAGSYVWNLGLLPLRLLQTPIRNYECNTGYCLPGDPVPYMLYPPLR